MPFGLNVDLLISAGVIGLLGFAMMLKYFRVEFALAIAFIKVAIPFVYFGWFFGRAFIEDWESDSFTYLEQGIALLNAGYTPLTVLFSGDGIRNMLFLADGIHILYTWYNVLAEYLFGQYMFSPVLLNVALTFVIGGMLYKIVRLSGYGELYGKWLWVFFVLHYEILMWSSLYNRKDTVVMAVTATMFLCFMRWALERKLWAAGALIGFVFAMIFLRFYVPLLFLGSVLAWMMLNRDQRPKMLVMVAVAVLWGIIILYLLEPEELARISAVVDFSLGGWLRRSVLVVIAGNPYFLTDVPFDFWIAVFHWLFLIPAVVGGVLLWRHSSLARLPIIYVVMLVVFTAAAEDVFWYQRARYQVIFILAWMQFHFFWVVLKKLFSTGPHSGHSASAPTGVPEVVASQ